MYFLLSRRAKRALTHFTLLTLAASPAYAAAALPGSGSVLDSVKPPEPAAPAPEISVKEQTPAPLDGGELIPVKAFRIDGQPPVPAAGLGLLWVRDNDFSVRLDYAWKVGNAAATDDTDQRGRCWLQGVKYF